LPAPGAPLASSTPTVATAGFTIGGVVTGLTAGTTLALANTHHRKRRVSGRWSGTPDTFTSNETYRGRGIDISPISRNNLVNSDELKYYELFKNKRKGWAIYHPNHT
jgi:hypothetical protein